MVPSDAQLVKAALKDDLGAFQSLVDRYKRKVYFISLGILGNHHDAEDVLQESLLHAFSSLRRLRQPDSFGSWIMRMAYNRSIDLRRKRVREIIPDHDNGIEFFDSVESNRASGNPERSLKSSDIGRIVKGTMDKLPESQRTAFLLKHIAQLSIREIASATNSTEATVKTNIYRAVQRIRLALSSFSVNKSVTKAVDKKNNRKNKYEGQMSEGEKFSTLTENATSPINRGEGA